MYDASTGELMFDAGDTGALTAVVLTTVTVGAQVTTTDFLIV